MTSEQRLGRRAFLKLGAAALATSCAPSQTGLLKVAMLHLEPRIGEMDRNCDLYGHAMETAARAGAEWILTPELGLTGYRFDLAIGTDWIRPSPDEWVNRLRKTAARLGVTLFLGHLELDAADGKRYNTVFVIGPDGSILGRHRKMNVIPVSEAWSTPGSGVAPVRAGDIDVGILICADAWPEEHARGLKAKGADLLVSSATWAPEPHGPETCWEQRTLDTGLPLMVCNRTGVERDFDMRASESVVVAGGKRLVRHTSEHSSVLLVEWDLRERAVARKSVVGVDAL